MRQGWYKRTFLSVKQVGTKSFFHHGLRPPYAFPLTGYMTTSSNVPAGTVLFTRGTHGSRERLIRNLYAYRVAAAIVGAEGICPSCSRSFYVDNDGNVDRTITGCASYVTGEIVYLCGDCNQSRNNGEWSNVDAYRATVAAASLTVDVPTAREAREWWNSRPVKPATARRWA
jgi:hypothetical protein